MRAIWIGIGLGIALSACSTVPKGVDSDPKALLAQACAPGRDVVGTQGSVWLKAQSQEAKGQFPAGVSAQTPGTLRLEITNLVGGTEAVITVEGPRYLIQVPGKNPRSEKGFGSWGGIPLRWATELFLGRIPCPSAADLEKAALSVDKDGVLTVRTQASIEGEGETYVYRFRSWAGGYWPDSLRWERKGAFAAQVDFKFDDPEDKTASPRKWEAKSPQGEVKVRWRDRDVKTS